MHAIEGPLVHAIFQRSLMLVLQHIFSNQVVILHSHLDGTEVEGLLSEIDGHGGVFLPVGAE